jgi:hypothetical protein
MEVFRIFELEYISSLQSSSALNVLNFFSFIQSKKGVSKEDKKGTLTQKTPQPGFLCVIPPTPQNKKWARRLKKMRSTPRETQHPNILVLNTSYSPSLNTQAAPHLLPHTHNHIHDGGGDDDAAHGASTQVEFHTRYPSHGQVSR